MTKDATKQVLRFKPKSKNVKTKIKTIILILTKNEEEASLISKERQ